MGCWEVMWGGSKKGGQECTFGGFLQRESPHKWVFVFFGWEYIIIATKKCHM